MAGWKATAFNRDTAVVAGGIGVGSIARFAAISSPPGTPLSHPAATAGVVVCEGASASGFDGQSCIGRPWLCLLST